MSKLNISLFFVGFLAGFIQNVASNAIGVGNGIIGATGMMSNGVNLGNSMGIKNAMSGSGLGINGLGMVNSGLTIGNSGCGAGNPGLNVGNSGLNVVNSGLSVGNSGLGIGNPGVGITNVVSANAQGSTAIGYGDLSITGELPVGGSTAINGNVPVIGYVTFEGTVPAGGIVSVANGCGCNQA